MIAISVVVPAHDEEAVVGRLLRRLVDEAEEGELELVVVANGCRDGTADAARAVAPDAKVVELPVASKVAALNAGDRKATRFPRFYVDADVEVGMSALRRCASILEAGAVLCAGPTAYYELAETSPLVRSYFRVWTRLPYFNQDRIGAVVGVSEAGRRRFGPFPDVIADDSFVAQLFASGERAALDDCRFTVHPPRSLRALLSNRTRIHRGNRQLARSGLTPHSPARGALRSLAGLARNPAWWPAIAVYSFVTAIARLRAARPEPAWERDDTSRRDHGPDRDSGDLPAVGYVVSQYPKPSHTFILREVVGLRELGFEVATFSIRPTPDAELLSERDRDEGGRTVALLPVSAPRLIAVHGRLFLRHPRAWWRTLSYSVAVRPPGARAAVWQVFYFAEAGLLFEHARRAGIRHLHAHLANAGADVAWLATELGRACSPGDGWRWSFTMHGPTEFMDAPRFNLARKAASASRVVCISDFCRSQLMLHCDPVDWPKLTVVRCGVDIAQFEDLGRSRQADGTSRPMVLCVGRLTPEKGQRVLLDAAALLAARGVDFQLVLAGDGPDHADLRARMLELDLSGRVAMPGVVPQSEVRALLAGAQVFCLPSFAEGLPVVLMEAMAAGVPVVTTPIAGIPELVTDRLNGLLVPPGRSDLLADALQEMLEDPALRTRLSAAASAAVREKHDLHGNVRRMGEILSEGHDG